MTPLEAAKALAAVEPDDYDRDDPFSICHFCDGTLSGKPDAPGHTESCPWLAMPQIVAALERLAVYESHPMTREQFDYLAAAVNKIT